METAARAMVADAVDLIEAELSTLSALSVPGVALPMGIAVALLQARREAAEHQEAVGAHQARTEALRGRLRALEADRQVIVARRAEGIHEHRDGERLALADADIEGLNDLITRVASEGPARSTTDLHHHETAWNSAVLDARRAALLVMARQAEATLMKAAELLAATGKLGNTAGRYRPNPRLAAAAAKGIW